MTTPSQLRILNEFTKEEIIAWISEKSLFLAKPLRSDLLFVRWEIQSHRLSADYASELKRWDDEKPDFSIRDRLAQQFNASTDANERLRLLKEIKPFDDAFNNHIERYRALDKRQVQVDRLYERSQAARAEEAPKASRGKV